MLHKVKKERFFCRTSDEALGTQPIGKLMAQSCPAGRCRAVHQHAVQYRGPDLHRQHPRHQAPLALTGVGVTFPIHPAGLGLCRIRRNGRARRWLPSSWAPATVKVRKKFWATAFTMLLVTVCYTDSHFQHLQRRRCCICSAPPTPSSAMRRTTSPSTWLGTVFVQLALGLNAFISAQGHATVAMLSVLIGAVH